MTNEDAWLLVAVLLGAISFIVSALAMYRALEASEALSQVMRTAEGAHKTANSALAHAVAVRNDCATLGKQLARDSADIATLRREAYQAEQERITSSTSLPRTGPIAIPPSPWKRGPSK